MVRNKAPKGTINTQLHPGEDDYKVWMKVSIPHGSGRYERRDMKEIVPEGIAPKLNSKKQIETETMKSIINDATIVMNETQPR